MNYKAMKVISNPEGNTSLVRQQVSSVVIPMFKDTLSHYLVGYYTTHQPDGVHLSARFTCGEKFEGITPSSPSADTAAPPPGAPDQLLHYPLNR
jgi:hypothetical protein